MLKLPNVCCARLGVIMCGLLAMFSAQDADAEIPAGSSHYTFSQWSGPPLRVYSYRPRQITTDTPILIVMHGAQRDADRYRDEWVAVADELGLIIVAPEFDARRFPKSARYNLGGLGHAAGKADRDSSAFAAIEPLFDDARAQTGSQQTRYYLYGHSAGAQFVHRFIYANPQARIETAFAANAGWYTMPESRTAFPYGLKDSGLPASALQTALGVPLVILLGDADTERGGSLRVTPEADSQGPNRLGRGLNFFGTAAIWARHKALPFAWRLSIVPGAGHDNGMMAVGVRDYLMQQQPASTETGP
jgi:poly(3-hydroxybutyrate) depolymerase